MMATPRIWCLSGALRSAEVEPILHDRSLSHLSRLASGPRALLRLEVPAERHPTAQLSAPTASAASM